MPFIPLEVFANNPSTTVSAGGTTNVGGVSGTAETWTVASSASFPAADGTTQFHVADPAAPSEVVTVQNISGTTWTVTRGAENSTPVAHTASFTVVQVITAGTLISLQKKPWQFLPEIYGAKGDAAMLYDASMNGSTAVLTTAGLPAPPAPAVGNTGSGGTVLTGTYQVKVTYVNQFGETLASSSASTTTSGSVSVITVTSPLPWTNATGYYVYCTQAGGSTWTRQQSPGSPTPLRTNYAITAPPTSSGTNAASLSNTSASAPFTAGDVGKAIIVPSAGGFLNVPLVTTIASYQSAAQVTLAAVSVSAVTGYGAVYGTDDTAAIQSAVNAAVAYAQTAGSEQAIAEVILSSAYCVAGPLTGSFQNAQIVIPYVNPYAGPKVQLKLSGPQSSPGPVHWEQPNPPMPGGTIVSVYYNDTGSPVTPYPAVIGGPVTGFGGNGGLFSNMRVEVDGLTILAAYRPSICGLDLYGAGQADIRSFSHFSLARTNTAAGGWPAYAGGVTQPSAWQTYGYRAPGTGNNALSTADRLCIYGPYHGLIITDHFAAISVQCDFVRYAVTPSPQDGGIGTHHMTIQSLQSGAADAPLFCDNSGGPFGGGGNSVAIHIASLDIEDATNIINDAGNQLYGEVHAEYQHVATGVYATGKAGGANIKLILDYQPFGHVSSPPAVPSSGTPLANAYWQPATVSVHTGGGVTVSAIALDGTATGQTMAASSSLTLPVRNGGTITLTYAGGTPTWDWWLG